METWPKNVCVSTLASEWYLSINELQNSAWPRPATLQRRCASRSRGVPGKLVDSSKPRGGDRRKDCNGPNGVVSTALAGQSRRVAAEKSLLINR